MKTATFTCVGTKKITKKDGNVTFKSFLVHDPIESGVQGSQTSVLWGHDLVVGEIYEGILGYNRRGDYGIVDIFEG